MVANIASEGGESAKRIPEAVHAIREHNLDIDRGSRQAGRITEASSQAATSRSAVIRETANRIDALAARVAATLCSGSVMRSAASALSR